MGKVEWSCHICKRERPDEKIAVLSKPLRTWGAVVGMQNIRYCNDNPSCIEGAKTFDLFRKEGRKWKQKFCYR